MQCIKAAVSQPLLSIHAVRACPLSHSGTCHDARPHRNRRGQVLLATVNEQTMVPFVSQQLGNLELALAIARRGNLPGAEPLVIQNFDRLFAQGQYKEAAEAAAESPMVRAQLHEHFLASASSRLHRRAMAIR